MIPANALDAARDTAEEVAAFCLSRWDSLGPVDVEQKAPRDPVSAVDRAAEQMARDRLARACPGIPVVGEEGGGDLAPLCWIVDPLDGTTNYLSGLPLWCVSIGLVADGVPVLGAIAAPALGLVITGGQGDIRCQSASLGFRQPGVSLVAVGRNDNWPAHARQDRETRLEADGHSVVNLGSCALSLALVALGRLGGYVERQTRLWDSAAGFAICDAAGIPVRLGPSDSALRVDIAAGDVVLRSE